MTYKYHDFLREERENDEAIDDLLERQNGKCYECRTVVDRDMDPVYLVSYRVNILPSTVTRRRVVVCCGSEDEMIIHCGRGV